MKLKKSVNFKGREAVATQAAEGVKKVLAGFTIDDPNVILLGRETIYRNGERVGWLTSAGFGYTVGKSIGYGYVRSSNAITTSHVEDGDYELDVASERVKCNVHLSPLYDPAMIRIKT